MADPITHDQWAKLREDVVGDSIVREEVWLDGNRTPCFIAVDGSARLHLLVPVADDQQEMPPELHGVVARYAEADEPCIDISALATLEAIVTPIFNQVVLSVVQDGRDPVHIVTEQMDLLRRAFTRVGAEISENKQIGLFGELWTLLKIMIPAIGPRAAVQWSGPMSERHDFVGTGAHIEVKTTTRSEDKHEISRIDQLRAPTGKRLLLVSLQLERTQAGQDSIATMRDQVIAALNNDGPALDAFERKMAAMGWYDGLIQTGSLLKFNIRSALPFDVAGNFPRLPDEYVLPRGVTAIEYTINISAFAAMAADECLAIAKTM